MTKEVERHYENNLWGFIECPFGNTHHDIVRLKHLYNPSESELSEPTDVEFTKEEFEELQDILKSYLKTYSSNDWYTFVSMYNSLVTNVEYESIKKEYEEYLFHGNKESFIENITKIISNDEV